MKTFAVLLCAVVLPLFTRAQVSNTKYDSTLAARLGADDYGMKNYVLVMLKTGSNKTADKAFIDSCFDGHMKNINRLVEINKLVVGGPFGKNEQSYRGLFIFDVKTMDEAKALLQTDPAVHAKLLDADLFEWYGSAALREYLPAAEKITKVKW